MTEKPPAGTPNPTAASPMPEAHEPADAPAGARRPEEPHEGRPPLEPATPAAAPASPAPSDDGSRIVDRSLYRIVQTPQVFRADILRNAYARPFDERFTDDASVVEAAGQPVYLCEGSYENIKITTPVDMLTAEALLAQRQRTSATAGE